MRISRRSVLKGMGIAGLGSAGFGAAGLPLATPAISQGATNVIHYIGTTSMSAPDLGVPRQFPATRRVQQGDVVVAEISAAFWEHPGQVLRSFALGDRFEAFIDAQVQGGRYNNASEVVRDALRLLEDREKLRELKLAELRRLAEEGRAIAGASR